MVEDEIKLLKVPAELNEFIGDYYKALVKRADNELVGESEYRCFKRFLICTISGKNTNSHLTQCAGCSSL